MRFFFMDRVRNTAFTQLTFDQHSPITTHTIPYVTARLSVVNILLDCLTPDAETDRLSRNAGN
jgi:hypothetical protein